LALIVAFVPDLMLSSRVSGALSAAGHDVVAGAESGAPELPPGAELVVCDLEAVDSAAIAALGVPSLGFYSHVDVDTRRRALADGVDLVVPRSRMARELPDLVAGML
jgi:hypothetical protein